MNVSLWGIRNPAGAVIIFVALCLAGIYGLRQLPIATLPDFTVPQITVTVTLAGATPGQLETDVTRKVEDAIASIANIDKINSTITEGSSRTRIQFMHGPRHGPGTGRCARCRRPDPHRSAPEHR
jgi:multidrug efflux pump subunit AcrB